MAFPKFVPDQFAVTVISHLSLKDRVKSQLADSQGK